MYRPAIMGLLFCSAILLGSVFCVYWHNVSNTVTEQNSALDLQFRPLTEEEISSLEAALVEWDCELLREGHGWDTSDATH